MGKHGVGRSARQCPGATNEVRLFVGLSLRRRPGSSQPLPPMFATWSPEPVDDSTKSWRRLGGHSTQRLIRGACRSWCLYFLAQLRECFPDGRRLGGDNVQGPLNGTDATGRGERLWTLHASAVARAAAKARGIVELEWRSTIGNRAARASLNPIGWFACTCHAFGAPLGNRRGTLARHC